MAAFTDASEWFLESVPHASGHWDEPGLGEWSVRDLVGHASRSFVTVETYLDQLRDQPPAEIDVTSAVDYYRRISVLAAAEGVAQRGRDA